MGTFSLSSISATTVAVAPTGSTMSSVASMSDVARTWWSKHHHLFRDVQPGSAVREPVATLRVHHPDPAKRV
jgi:hypothetical protein